MKSCNTCSAIKPVSEFYSDKGKADGLCGRCKSCAKAHSRAWEKQNPERVKARRRLWRAARIEDIRAYDKARQEKLPDEKRDYQFFKHGISRNAYIEIFAAQGGVCAICGRPETCRNNSNGDVRWLAVDHDHISGAVRGLLCNFCNVGLGYFRDSSAQLRLAARYLEQHRKSPGGRRFIEATS